MSVVISSCEGISPLKNVSDSPDPGHQPTSAPAKKQKQFIVIEIPTGDQHDYPKAIFACDTADEASMLCKRMNTDAGYERYGIQRPASGTKKEA